MRNLPMSPAASRRDIQLALPPGSPVASYDAQATDMEKAVASGGRRVIDVLAAAGLPGSAPNLHQ
jgi:hypothetical protein